MGRYLAIRGLRALLTVIFVVTFAFVVLRLSGDPALLILSPEAPPEAVEAFRKSWGLDRPLWEQYLRYFAAIFDGNLGRSMRDGRPAIELVMDRVPQTLAITLPAFALKLLICVPAGIVAALYRNSIIDRLVIVCSVAGHSVPSFVLGLMLVLLFAVTLKLLPAGGFPGWGAGLGPALKALALPAVALALPQAAILARVTRSALVEVLGEDFIRTARAKGLPWRAVLWRHALRNALIPVVTIMGLQFSFLLAGTVIIENVFYLPGLGRLVFQAITQRDLIVVESVVMLLVASVIAVNLVVDLSYALVDPRLRHGR